MGDEAAVREARGAARRDSREPRGRQRADRTFPRLFHLAEAGSAPAISEHGLLPAKEIVSILTDMTAWQWLSALNERVFFWLHSQRLDQLLNARRNRGRPHEILVIDTASMVSAHDRRIRLSAINSGSTLYPNAPERGTRTFQTIEDYPFAERIRSRAPQAAVVELAVSGGVRDISSHVIDVYRGVA